MEGEKERERGDKRVEWRRHGEMEEGCEGK